MIYDIAIVGGGLSGLSLSIQLIKAGYTVIVFEKEKYPFHRVCGEYISMESWSFITDLGIDLKAMNLPVIKNLILSSPSGKSIAQPLDLGGFGISRYKLDYELYKLALTLGVQIREKSKVEDVLFNNNTFSIVNKMDTIIAKVVVGSYGKRSNLDLKWQRKFITRKPGKLNNYIGIKYHIRTKHPIDTIALHNFKNGYCGISKIEDDKFCLCYLTTAAALKDQGSIARLEKNVLAENPFIKNIFNEAEFLYASPITISQISFDDKSAIDNHILMVGDTAGMITPLCGNGMSMAFHSGKIAFEHITTFLQNKCSRIQMEQQYEADWKKHFAGRLTVGRLIQSLFGKVWLTNAVISVLKPFPFIITRLIKATHGKPF